MADDDVGDVRATVDGHLMHITVDRSHKMNGFAGSMRGESDAAPRPGQVAGEILDCAPLAVQEIKRASLLYLEEGEAAAFAEIDAMRSRTAGSEDFGEGLSSFMEKRPARFTGR